MIICRLFGGRGSALFQFCKETCVFKFTRRPEIVEKCALVLLLILFLALFLFLLLLLLLLSLLL